MFPSLQSTYICYMGGFFFRIVLLFLPVLGMAQEKSVNSTAFRLLLNGMLKHDVKEISVDSAHQLFLQSKAQFIDAREKKEYEVSHIKDATWSGYDDFKMERIADLDKNQPVVVYCSIGYRSEQITRKLKEEGFTEVYNLYGGIFEWVNRDFPIHKNEYPTDSIHGFSKMWSVWLKKGNVVY